MQENAYVVINDLILIGNNSNNSDKLAPNTNTKHTDYENTLH